MFLNTYFGVLIVYVVFTWLFAIIKPLNYGIYLKLLRKTLYVLFILTLGLGIISGRVDLNDWLFIVTVTALTVFIDLSVLMTPSILKIWRTEFQNGSEFLEEMIKKNDKIQKSMVAKVGYMSVLIQKSDLYFEDLQIPENQREYAKGLETYLEQYSDEFGLKVHIREFPTFFHENESEIKDKIKTELIKIDRIHNFDFNYKEIDEYIDAVYNSEIISMVENDSMIIPIYLENRNIIVVLKNDKGTLLEVDGVHIANLVYLFDSYR
ncbi:type II toxin-antitoxin system SpoIISA family toxin [Bacillus sp. V59.32b]|uniref:type II toxin-antitoxin system SpoIISA family toxin n=1 Tax=Bacillus sp. V59.32b TaxID=1758642 RepID=UPI00135674B5|nr:type II toxin-antitoxin system SpoIISA family toxin [Bacillus sp. V59.32b]